MKLTLTGELTNAWFDIISNNQKEGPVYNKDQAKFASTSLAQIVKNVAEQYHEGDFSKVWLAGYKEGGCLALHAAYTMKQQIGGVLSICSGLT